MKKQKSASFWVAIALILCLISSLGASMVQTGGGAIKYHDITMVTDSGHELDALLLVPKNATRENPAPAIVTSHGWYNNREMQDLNYVEYARRGYVVISISMYGHGDSEVIPDGTWWDAENNANGLYDAVKYIARRYRSLQRRTCQPCGCDAGRGRADRRRTAGVQRCRLQEGRSVGQHLWQP